MASSELAVQCLVEAGADVNALMSTQQDVPFPHYPFVLPIGSPLHWAVTLFRHGTIKALVEAGASPILRNGCDPYMYDDRIRWLYAVGGADSEGCTFPEPDCLGLSSLDLAAIHRDCFLSQHLVSVSTVIDMDLADEEGFTVLHRLATSQVFRTSRRATYSPRPFRDPEDVKILQTIIKLTISLGGNIEMLTSSAESARQKKQRSFDSSKSSYTPLMLAMLEGDEDLVDALLACGASVHTENQSGETALFHISHRAHAEQRGIIKCVQKLVAQGADVNHHSANGNCALLAVSQSRLVEVFEYLLSKGANIDETDRKERTITPGKSVFANFASTEDGVDEWISELLTKHVFGPLNAAKKDRVVLGSADSGRTNLHDFASQAMPKRVAVLLQNGAKVNALQRQTRFMSVNPPGQSKKVWHEIPWDALQTSGEFILSIMLARNTHSLQQIQNVQARWDECQRLLDSSGGMTCTRPATFEAWT